MMGWGGGDGRPPKRPCLICGKLTRGLGQHRRSKHPRQRLSIAEYFTDIHLGRIALICAEPPEDAHAVERK